MLFRKSILDKELDFNYLALCPACAAMFLYARKTEDTEIESAIQGGLDSIEVELADRVKELRFAPAHHLDIRTALDSR
jgi:hypothetical protein